MIFDKNKNVIYCDQDGVLADFDRFVFENMGRTFDHQAGPSDKEMWDFLRGVDDMYYKLEPTPYAKELWDFANSIGCPVRVLTAIPRRTSMPEAENQKRRWFKKHRDIFGDNVHVAIGPYSRDKWKHANPGDILIDDRTDNIKDWIEKGRAIGVLHKHIQDTINSVRSAVR